MSKRKKITDHVNNLQDSAHESRMRLYAYAIGRHSNAAIKGDTTEITLYDVIGDFGYFGGVSAKAFKEILDGVETPKILLKINSPGGDIFDAHAIYNDLRTHEAEVTVQITGLAASAASYIAMAGDRIEIAKNAHMMIHNVWTIAIGNRNDFREVADVLEEFDDSIVSIYADKTGTDAAAIKEMMDSETWMRGEKAVELGFADDLFEEDKKDGKKAAFDIGVFKNAPSSLKRNTENVLRDAGYSLRETKAALSEGFHKLRLRDAGGRDDPHALRDEAGDLTDLERSLRDLEASFRPAA